MLIRGAGVITGYASGGRPGAIDDDGWLDTGDLGYLDADGYLFLVGRSDDVINRGGEKIYPREIEEILLAQPGVRSAAVIGAVDEVLGERPVAYVVPDGAAVADEVEALLRAVCAERLPRHKQPSEFWLVDEMPLGPTGKISRRLLKESVAGSCGREFHAVRHLAGRVSSRWRGRRSSRPHIIAFDMIRLIIMVFVVSVHTLAFAGGRVTMSIGAVTTIFHTSRELFLLLTALVLTYNYGHRDQLKAGRFWRRRFWLVLPAYVTWSAIYYAADGRARGAFPMAFLHDLENAGARYHLYFLLVSMQIYLLFPVIRWVLKKTEGYHAWLFGVAVAYQAWLTVGLHYKVGRHGNGLIAQFLNGAGQGYWVDTYVLYVVAGALAGWHFEQLCAFTRRHLRSGWRVALVAAVGVAAGIGVYLIEIEVFGATPDNASAVFQPVVIFEALAFGWALLGAGLLWSDRGAPGRKFAAAGSASSFGIYLAHPLVLQVLLLIAGSTRPRGQRRPHRRPAPPPALQPRGAGAAVHRGAADLRHLVGDRLRRAADPGQPPAHRA